MGAIIDSLNVRCATELLRNGDLLVVAADSGGLRESWSGAGGRAVVGAGRGGGGIDVL